MKVILSPAKSILKPIHYNELPVSVPFFMKEAEILVRKLKKMKAVQLAKLMHISADLAELNYQRYQQWEAPLKYEGEIFPAILGFNGEAYKGFDAASLTKEEMERAQDTVRLLSGLYGILKPLDLIYPYRLEMGTKWEITPKQKNLYQFWGTKLAEYLNREMDAHEVLINLASSEYNKAVDRKKLKSKMVTPVFKEFKNGEYKMIMMYAKHARGAMSRYIIKNNIQDPEELKLYNVDNYSFDDKLSTEDEWTFVR